MKDGEIERLISQRLAQWERTLIVGERGLIKLKSKAAKPVKRKPKPSPVSRGWKQGIRVRFPDFMGNTYLTGTIIDPGKFDGDVMLILVDQGQRNYEVEARYCIKI